MEVLNVGDEVNVSCYIIDENGRAFDLPVRLEEPVIEPEETDIR